MDIYKLLGTLWGEHERARLNKSAIILYFRLIYEANKSFWKGPIVISWEYLGRVLGFSPETLGRAISDLKSRGLITYERKGKHSAFWFPQLYFDSRSERMSENEVKKDEFQVENSGEIGEKSRKKVNHFDSRSENSSKNINHFDNRSRNSSENRSEDRSENRSENSSDNNNINNNILIQENKKIVNKESNREFPNGNSATKVANEPPKWYLQLDEKKKDIVDTWRTLIGPFDPKWLPLVSQVLRECYPAQIKNAIVTLAKTKAEVMQEQGFEYVVEPLLKGVFGKRTKRKKKTTAGFASKLTGLKQFLEEGEENA